MTAWTRTRTPNWEPLPERELRADLIAAENAELATRQRLQRSLDLEVTRLAERQR